MDGVSTPASRDGESPLFDWRGNVARFRGHAVEHHRVEVAGMTLQIAAMKDAAALLDEPDFAERFVDKDIAPYGVELWPAALMLAEHLVNENQRGVNFPKRHVPRKAIELGCGLGLVSIVAAKLGWAVIAADYEPTALAFAAYNAKLNSAPVEELVALDWRCPPTDRRFDYVFGADILYQLVDHKPVLECIDTLLTSCGNALIADPNRGIADRFPESAADDGFSVEEYSTSVTVPVGRTVEGRIFRLYRA